MGGETIDNYSQMIISSTHLNKSFLSKSLQRHNKLELYCHAELKNNFEKKESRIGKQPISVPKDVKVTLSGQKICVQGPNGDSSIVLHDCITASTDNEQIKVIRKDDSRRARELHGLSRTLLNNMIIGTSVGFEKKLTMVGVGYRAKINENQIVITAGFSHDVIVPLPNGIQAKVNQNVNISIYGSDKSNVSNFAAELRRIRPPEPYGGKGIRYDNEVIKMKDGK